MSLYASIPNIQITKTISLLPPNLYCSHSPKGRNESIPAETRTRNLQIRNLLHYPIMLQELTTLAINPTIREMKENYTL